MKNDTRRPRRTRGPDRGKRTIHCGWCGEPGHQWKTCPDPRAKAYWAEERERMKETDS